MWSSVSFPMLQRPRATHINSQLLGLNASIFCPMMVWLSGGYGDPGGSCEHQTWQGSPTVFGSQPPALP